MEHFVYIVRCRDGTYYTGYTTDLAKRIKAHNNGTGAKYTRGRGPVELLYMEECSSKEAAMQREWAIKSLTRQEKQRLIDSQRAQ
jgi:putative endonuclease